MFFKDRELSKKHKLVVVAGQASEKRGGNYVQ